MSRVTGDFGEARFGRNFAKAQAVLDTQVMKDTTPFVPFDTDNLWTSAQRATDIGSGEVVWEGPYAAAQYYGLPNKSHDKHTLAVMRWFEASKAVNKPAWLRIVKRLGGGR